jgi:serine protease
LIAQRLTTGVVIANDRDRQSLEMARRNTEPWQERIVFHHGPFSLLAKAVKHFGYNSNATYIVLTPPRTIGTGEGAVYCAYHSQTTSVNGLGNPARIQYAFIPWLNENWPGSGTTGCGMHSVNATSDAFGNGIFDGYSIVTGHEYSEAVTDPDNFTSIQDGWNDDTTMENADKCAWIDMQNIALGGHQFAVQPTWSNEAFDATGNGCAVSR